MEAAQRPLIYEALARAMTQVGAVGKDRKNQGQGYQFRGIDQVVQACQLVLANCGIVVVPFVAQAEREMLDSKSGGKMFSVRLVVDHHFYAPDGSSVVARTVGEAMDAGDKASNKAMSAALKYALTETLLIPVDEPDRDIEESNPAVMGRSTPQTQAQMVEALERSIAATAPASPPSKPRLVESPKADDPTAALAQLLNELKAATTKTAINSIGMRGSKVLALNEDLRKQFFNAVNERHDQVKGNAS